MTETSHVTESPKFYTKHGQSKQMRLEAMYQEMREKIEAGLAQLERGEGIPGDVVIARLKQGILKR